MSNYKIVFAGPVGVGKTTAIKTISEIEPVTTDEYATDEVRKLKETTTVAMDFGLLSLDNGECIHLYGAPGQVRFDFMWDILTEGGIGLVLLLNHEHPRPLEELDFYLNHFMEFIRKTALVIGITRMHPFLKPDLDDYAARLSEHGLRAPILVVDPRKRGDVITLVQALLFTIDPSIDI